MDYDMDVDDPDKVAPLLRRIAQRYIEDGAELDAAWQDKMAGAPWRIVARELEKCAAAIERKLS